MEWYEWVFAFCGASMAVSTVLLAQEFYADLRARAPRRSEKSRRGR